jgi:hypothetical protein
VEAKLGIFAYDDNVEFGTCTNQVETLLGSVETEQGSLTYGEQADIQSPTYEVPSELAGVVLELGHLIFEERRILEFTQLKYMLRVQVWRVFLKLHI